MTTIERAELISAAAKAAKLHEQMHPRQVTYRGQSWVELVKREYRQNGLERYELWDPINDSADALQLAVALDIAMRQFPDHKNCAAYAQHPDVPEGLTLLEPYNRDPLAATRMAITRMAAMLGDIAK